MLPSRLSHKFQVYCLKKKKQFSDWLTPAHSCSDNVHWKFCLKNFYIGSMDLSAITGHMQSAEHKRRFQEHQQPELVWIWNSCFSTEHEAGPSSSSEVR